MLKTARWVSRLALALLPVVIGSSVYAQTPPLYPNYPSETPATFRQPTYGMDYERREVMIRMRDGVKLHTVILIPKGAKNAGHSVDAHSL